MNSPHTESKDSFQENCLKDNHNRLISYLRLSVTDRCNLRCRYCRPAEGVPFVPHDEILSFEELEYLVTLFCSIGVNKIRVTGGEPFSRRGCMGFLERLRQLPGVQSLHITTNGVKPLRYLDKLLSLGLDSINLSLDTLDQQRFWKITRRNYLDAVLQTVEGILARKIPLKINSVILDDTIDEEIMHLSDLAREHPITLRFIESMPFSGTARDRKLVNGNLLKRLQGIFPGMQEYVQDAPSTARVFTLPGYRGMLGLIQGHSRLFCNSCNKIRITSVGMLKTCLYDNGVLDLKQMMRTGCYDEEIKTAVLGAVRSRFVNGHEAEQNARRVREPSMASIGG